MNDENLLKPNDLTSSELRERASKGGKASGRARREKANLRKLAQQVLDDSYKDSSGNEYTGAELFVRGLVSNLANPDGKNWSKTMDLLITLTGAGKSKEEIEAIKAQAKLTMAKVDLMTGSDTSAIDKLDEILKEMRENADSEPKTE